MPIDPVKIPQNVYIEDRIVGPLTLKQILMVALGGGFSYTLYSTLAQANGGSLSIVPTVLVWIPCAISVVFALVKINDLTLFRILLLTIEKMNKPPLRTWAPRQGLTIHIRTGGKEEVQKGEQMKQEEQKRIATMQKTQHHIQELSSVLDRPLVDPDAPALDAELSLQPPPVDPNSIQTDAEPHDDLSTFRNVFRDISPHP